MVSSLGFERANTRARDGLHRSANKETRQEYSERRRRDHDIQIAIGRWVLPRTHSRSNRHIAHPVATFADRMGQGDNRHYGESVDSPFLILQYLSPNMMANLFDCYLDKKVETKKSQKLVTPRGRKEMFRSAKKDIQKDFRELQKGIDQRELELEGTIRRRIFEDTKNTGVIELAVHRSVEVEEVLSKDLEVINTVLEKRLPGAPEIFAQDVSLRIPVFTIDKEFLDTDIEIARPLLPMAPVSFQPLGIHEIPST